MINPLQQIQPRRTSSQPLKFAAQTNPLFPTGGTEDDTSLKDSLPILNWGQHLDVPITLANDQRVTYRIERAGPEHLAREDDKRAFQLLQLIEGHTISALKDIAPRRQEYSNPKDYCLLVKSPQGEIIGSGYLNGLGKRLPGLGNNGAMMGHLMIHPDHQGHGLAKLLTDLRLAAAKPLGYEYLLLFTKQEKVEGTPERPGMALKRGFRYLGHDPHYRWYALNLVDQAPLDTVLQDQLRQKIGLRWVQP